MKTVSYRKGYKYQIAEDLTEFIDIRPANDINTQFISLSAAGKLTVKVGYACDGPSSPAIDTHNFMRGSFIHDALYQLMREGYIRESYREYADQLLHDICREDGMSSFRAWYVLKGVQWYGARLIKPSSKREILVSPQ